MITPITYAQQQVLMASLNPERISNRKQGSSTLSYLEAWDVKATLVRVFGFGGFSAEAEECEIVRIENNIPKYSGYGKDKKELPIEYSPDGQIRFGTANFRVTARVRVRLTIHQIGAVYSEWAASSQTGPDLGEVTDFAIKTAESDALKRAAIYLGTQFGLSLYDNGSKQDVIRRVFSPGQEWPRNPDPAPGEEKDAGEEVPDPTRPVNVITQFIQPAPGVTPEQHQENLALMQRALSAKAAQSTPDQVFETAMDLVPDRDEVPMALAGDRDE